MNSTSNQSNISNLNKHNSMSKIISVSNHKGGVGKTTTALNFGAALAFVGKRVLLIDLDPQANLSQSLGIVDEKSNIYAVIKGECPLLPIEIFNGFFIVPSSLDLSGAEVELSNEPGREYVLKELLEPLRSSYDYIIIDCPPSLALLTINAFTAADEILIPLQAEYLAMQGVAKLLDVIEKIKKRLNPQLFVGGIIITQYDSRKILNRDVVSTIETYSKDFVYKTKIRNTISLAEAPSEGLDIFRYNIKSTGATDYMALCEEYLKRQ